MRARRLVADGEVDTTLLIPAPVADRVLDVEQLVVLGNPAVGLGEAAGDVVHAVGGREGEAASLEVLQAVVRRDDLDLHVDRAAGNRVLRGALARLEIGPGVVRDVVGSAGLIDAQEFDRAAVVRDPDAYVVAVDGHGPVGYPVGVDLAAQDANRRAVCVVWRNASGFGTDRSGQPGKKKSGEQEHVVDMQEARYL